MKLLQFLKFLHFKIPTKKLTFLIQLLAADMLDAFTKLSLSSSNTAAVQFHCGLFDQSIGRKRRIHLPEFILLKCLVVISTKQLYVLEY